MKNPFILTGRIVNGVGKASFFTALDWVQKQCVEKLHFSPYPGTLNIEIDESSIPILRTLQKRPGVKLLSPDPNFCNARALPAFLRNVGGAIIIPDEEVNIHGKNILEVIAPVCLKEMLAITDGERVNLVVTDPLP
jgi:CTP-dependent riboflavin kinase